jgi:oxygen-independent coproporphyrinogen III oxidase
MVASLYFHIPFCTQKCPYCHFYVLPDKAPLKELLMEGLAIEWRSILPLLNGREITSIYFGGGTPTLLGAERIATLLGRIPRSPDCEITIEANPENTTVTLMRELASCGVNRVSIGVQSLDNSSLNLLGRGHSARGALQAIENSIEAGIENLSIDLMYDLPGQTLSSWQQTLSHLKELPITHLSLYNLTLEPNTPFFKRKKSLEPLLPNPDESLAMLTGAISLLDEIGLKRYEISAFAKPGFESRHNTGYWTGRPFLGLGPSAFSYWDKKRFRNALNLKYYVEQLKEGKSPIDFEERLPFPRDIEELLAIRLRLLQGVDLSLFQTEYGPLPATTLQKLSTLHSEGFLSFAPPNHIRLSEKGTLFYDSVATELM